MSNESKTTQNWAPVILGELGHIHCGQSPTTADVNSKGVGTVYISGPEHWDGHTLEVDKWTTKPKRMVPEGCLFITVKGAGVGTIFPGVAGAIGRDIYAFEPHPDMHMRFVRWALVETIEELKRNAVGDIPGLSKSHIADHRIHLPPAPEQHRIVEAIESYFSRLDDAVATLERVQRNLKRYRASVLKAAVEGRLVPTEAELARNEGRDYEPASALLDRILAERRRRWEEAELAKMKAKGKPPKDDKWKAKYKEPAAPDTTDLPELPDGWCWTNLDMLTEVQGGLTKGKKRKPTDVLRELPYLRVANVQRGYLDLSVVKTILATQAEIELLSLNVGDVLFNEGGDRDKLGRGWVWQGELSECLHQNHVFRARPCHPSLQPKFLSHYGNSNGRQYFIDQGKQTTNLASINLTKLRALPVPLPPAPEQVRIVAEVDDVLSISKHSDQLVERNLKRASRLRQAILKWAFEGKLADQDPNDEPAAALLKRIQAERARQPKKVRRGLGRTKTMARKGNKTQRGLVAVLTEAGGSLRPEELLEQAGYGPDSVGAFYEELRAAVRNGTIKESRPDRQSVLLEVCEE